MRTALAGPVAIAAIVLPRTTPIRWWAVGLALVLFAVLLVLQYRGSRDDDDTTRSILLTAVAANAASTMGVIATNDPYGMLLFLFPIVLLGALTMRRTLDVAVPAWSMGVAGVAIASFANGLPTNALISLTVLYAGFSLVLASCLHYIIGSVQHLAGVAEDYGTWPASPPAPSAWPRASSRVGNPSSCSPAPTPRISPRTTRRPTTSPRRPDRTRAVSLHPLGDEHRRFRSARISC